MVFGHNQLIATWLEHPLKYDLHFVRLSEFEVRRARFEVVIGNSTDELEELHKLQVCVLEHSVAVLINHSHFAQVERLNQHFVSYHSCAA